MASGMLDFYRGVDVKYQALAQMIVRPKYGAGVIASGSKQVIGSQANTLVGVDGKGMTYGGIVWLDDTLTQANSQVRLLSDDETLNDISFLRLNDYGITKPRSAVITINRYDAVNFIYSVGVSYGLTFEKSFELSYTEVYGRTPTVHYRLFYALI